MKAAILVALLCSACGSTAPVSDDLTVKTVSNFRDDASVTVFDVAIDGHAGVVRCGIQRLWDKEGGNPFVTHNCWWVTANQVQQEGLAKALSR
jgi:hypothetical protein